MSRQQRLVPISLADLEHNAHITMDLNALDYYRSGANDMQTLRDNQEAFNRLRLRPRILRDVSKVNTQTKLLGSPVSSPICLSPTAMQRLAHDEGEKATARALVITVDTPFLGRRLADVRNVFKLPSHMSMANFETKDSKVTMANILDQPDKQDAAAQKLLNQGSNGAEKAAQGRNTKVVKQESSLAAYVVSQIDPTLNWKDIEWIRSITKLPIVVKGVMTAEDAKLAADAGCQGILVSNHGGRQLDGVLATIDALPEVLEAVKGRNVEVYLDGGVRKGTDVFKALALGAKAVFLGRPVLWGLAHNGEEGVSLALNLIQQEFELAMALAGCCQLSDITRDFVQHGTNAHSKL
ncbi:Hydroxyacid oxidase 1 [Mortierella sp. NVP85]|nr:Hydroxyacid oxidase 1 [Mortierella sp. NVP85]